MFFNKNKKNKKKQNALHIFVEIFMILLTVGVAILMLDSTNSNTITKIDNFFKKGDISIEDSLENIYSPKAISLSGKALSEIELSSFQNSIKNKEKMTILHEYLIEFVRDNHLEEVVSLEYSIDGIYLIFNDSVLFDSADSELKESAIVILSKITRLLLEVDNPILVEGHTDDLPINSEFYSSNWDLASKRAISVIELFEIQGISSDRFTAVSYGDTKPIAANNTDDSRKKNRRVVIYIKQNY